MSPNDAAASGSPEAQTRAKAEDSPDPEDSRKPDTPRKLAKPAWGYVFGRTIREFSKDQCTDLAAALTYYAVLAIAPTLLALVSLLGVFGQAETTTNAVVGVVRGINPDVAQTLQPIIANLASSTGAGLTLLIGILGAVWSASGYVGAFSRAMNRVYEIEEGRPIWKLRPVTFGITLVVLLLVVLMALLLILSGPVAQSIGDTIGLGSTAVTVWNIAKWPVMVLFAVIMIAILYYGSPNVKQPKFRWMSMGALIALLVLALTTLGFFFYVANFGSYQATYGAIAGVIILLLWLWIANLSLLFGAEFDAEVERGRQLQGGIEAEDTIQLPPRDTKQSDKKLEKERKDINDGRELRLKYARKARKNQDK